MKKILSNLIFALIFAIIAGAFVSCGGKGGSEVSGEVFSDGLKITEKNLTADVYYEYDGDSMTAVIKMVDGVDYHKSESDYYWYEGGAFDTVATIEAIGNHFSELSYADGAYTAESLILFLTTREGDAYDWEIVNLSVKINSSGELAEIYYEEEEIDANRIYKITFSNYGSTTAPSKEDIADPNAATEGPSGPSIDDSGLNSGAEMDKEDMNAGADNPEDKEMQSLLTEEEWKAAFDLEGSNFTAHINASSPGGAFEYEYRALGSEVYYTDPHNIYWMQTDFADFEQNFSPFVNTYSDYEFDGATYFCSVSSLDFGEGVSVIDVYIRFDENGRLIHLSYTLVMNDEYGNMIVDFYNYGETVAPDLSENNDASQGNAADGNVPNIDDAEGSDASAGIAPEPEPPANVEAPEQDEDQSSQDEKVDEAE